MDGKDIYFMTDHCFNALRWALNIIFYLQNHINGRITNRKTEDAYINAIYGFKIDNMMEWFQVSS